MGRNGRLLVAMVCLLSLPAEAAQILHRPSEVEPESLDPLKGGSGPASAVENDLFEGLVALDQHGNIVPGVAERWERAEDGVTYIFHLRTDARWSNGDPVTADDFVYAWGRIIDPTNGAASVTPIDELVNGREINAGTTKDITLLAVEAIDAHTLRAVTAKPSPLFLVQCADPPAFPVHRATIERWGRDWTQPGHMVSNGPFVLTAWVPLSKIIVTKNASYWARGSVGIDEVEHVVIDGGEEGALRRFRGGELDYVRVPNRDLPAVRRTDGARLHIGLANWIHTFAFNMTTGPFAANKLLRQALALTYDPRVVVEKLLPQEQRVGDSWVPPTVPNYTPQQVFYADMTMERRLTLARQLYAEAGFGPGHPFKFVVQYSRYEDTRTELLAATHMWKAALGVEATIEAEEFQVYLQRIKRGDYEMTVLGNSSTIEDPFDFLIRFRTGWSDNYSQYSNPAVDALLDRAGVTLDPEERRNLYQRAERRIADDVPGIPSQVNSIVMLVNAHLMGWVDDRPYPQSRWFSFDN
ncbi:MAG: oppA 2 [Rhodospirillales bacterium]|nr:oppA 2 [Rhodospirillales bacterium]